ncbi:MAG: MBL fold metallo-hydrolase [Candidatus Bathyarchaeia archaeon]|jgi:glyoxylase-like metal-dependent hydrolase (beta-lactamase superfamily II)
MISIRNGMQEIITVNHGGVNCYLIKTSNGFFLIDTGFSKKRPAIETDLQRVGCTTENLQLILLTHGDFDHTGNAAYLRQKYGAKIAMHPADVGMVENGDLFYSRKANWLMKAMGKLILVLLNTRLTEADRFTPDFTINENTDLSAYGLDAKIIHITGHSTGSIGILTSEGNLFCGDLLENKKEPAKGSLLPDKAGFDNSLKKLRQLEINIIYPGHGEPFEFRNFSI